MKIEILKMLDKWIFGIYIFRGWMSIDLPYRKINIMTDRVNKEIAEDIADKILADCEATDIQFIHSDEEMKKKLVKILLKSRV